MPASIAAGYRRGIATIVDANVVTLLTAFILFVLATAGVKGFALTLALGTITSLLTAVVFTQALLGTMSHSRLLRSPAALGAGGKPRVRWHFDFMGASRWFFSISGTILIVGSIALATKQLNLGIDFKSGTRVEVGLLHPTDENGVRNALDGVGISNAEVQRVTGNAALGSNAFLIQSKTLQPGRIQTLQRTLEKDFGIRTNAFDSTSVGPTFGTTVANSARNALIFSLLVICAYVALRFQPKFALPVLIALFHDILITAGVYALTGREVTSGTIAAFLTILGFSLYDTIIVFDRIRENLPRMPRAAFSQIVNRSMSEVLTTIARNQLLDPAPGAGAAAVRRHDPEGLRLRAAGRDRLRDVLVDIHRLAGAERLEGARARLPCPPRAHRGRDGHSAAVRRGGPGREAGGGRGGGRAGGSAGGAHPRVAGRRSSLAGGDPGRGGPQSREGGDRRRSPG